MTLKYAPLLAVYLVAGVGAVQGSSPASGLNSGDWTQIRAAYERHRNSLVKDSGEFRARNASQQWVTRFDGRGFTVRPDEGAWAWGLQLREYGFPGKTRSLSGQAQMRAEGARLVYSWDAALSEWFVNDGRGVEHGFTLASRPAGAGKLTFQMDVRGGLRAEGAGEGVGFFDAGGAAVVRYAGLRVWDADGRRLPARMTAAAGGVRIEVDEAGARYPLTVDPLAQQAYLKAPNTGAGDQFGKSVGISGDTVVVGAPGEDSGATTVNGSQADNSKSAAGAAYVFVRTGGSWTLQAYLKASNSDPFDAFGSAVAIDGNTIVVGATGEASANFDPSNNSALLSGAAYVFVRSGTTWTQQAYLKAPNAGMADLFGAYVSISGDSIAVGAPNESSGSTGINSNGNDNSKLNSGAAYVFVRSGTTWNWQAYIKASNTDQGDQFGTVSISGDLLIVGAPGEASSATGIGGNQSNNGAVNAGAAYVFVRSGSVWSQEAYLKASNAEAGDAFGSAVAISGSTAVVTALSEDSSATGVNGNQANNGTLDSGAAYVFVRSSGIWTQQAYLKASNTGANDTFGTSVAISGENVVIGAAGESSSATGVDSFSGDDSAPNAGAVYAFTRSGGTWSPTGYLKASNTAAYDTFGLSVSISGSTVVVGAPSEDSNATTVNGNEANNSAAEAGAAYVFTIQDPPTAVRFVPVTPCRIADTRAGGGASGAFGPPTLAANTVRELPIPSSSCGIPSNAHAYSLNITVVPTGVFGFLTVWPTGQARPTVSTLNSLHGGTVANAAIVRAGTNGSVSVYVENAGDVIVDINGYFVPASGSTFYTVNPCRLGDTRTGSGFTGVFGSPSYAGGETRTLPLPSGGCSLPATATAYSLNATVLPSSVLGYLSLFQAGAAAPFVSTLNSFDGAVVSNAALVPAGPAGAINAFVTNQTDLVLDVNGYFGPAGGLNALQFYPVTPCRISDTRVPGAGAPVLGVNEERSIVVGGRCGVPSTAKAFSLNVTAVPREPLGFLTLWPTGSTRPVVSTLNSFLGRIVANAAIAPAGAGGAVSVFVTNPTDVILDVNGYFQ